VLIVSGGNVDVTTMGAVIDRGLAAAERSVRLLVVLPDVPGALARLAGAIGDAGANIIEILHNHAPRLRLCSLPAARSMSGRCLRGCMMPATRPVVTNMRE